MPEYAGLSSVLLPFEVSTLVFFNIIRPWRGLMELWYVRISTFYVSDDPPKFFVIVWTLHRVWELRNLQYRACAVIICRTAGSVLCLAAALYSICFGIILLSS